MMFQTVRAQQYSTVSVALLQLVRQIKLANAACLHSQATMVFNNLHVALPLLVTYCPDRASPSIGCLNGTVARKLWALRAPQVLNATESNRSRMGRSGAPSWVMTSKTLFFAASSTSASTQISATCDRASLHD